MATLLVLGLAACGNKPNDSTPDSTPASTQPSGTTTTSSTASTTTTVGRSEQTPASTENVTTTITKPPISNYKPKPATAQTLANSKYLLTQKKAFNVAYYGGSITQGTGASKENQTSWRAITTAWLKSAYPDANITEIEAAVGGTGTFYGKMRAETDLLNYNPDLVFIEFVVNEPIDGTPLNKSKENLEVIIRKCYQKNPNIDIVLVYTCTAGSGTSNQVTQVFDEVANHYGLPIINVAKAIHKAGGDITQYYTSDKVHPNDKGYKAIADEVIAQMTAMLAKAGSPTKLTAHQNPQPIKENISLSTKIHTVDDILAQNPSLTRKGPNLYFEVDSAQLNKGNTLTFTFKGTSVGIRWRSFDKQSSTKIACHLDGQPVVIKELNHEMGTKTYELFGDLENTTHTLTFTYTGSTNMYVPYIFTTN